MTPELIQWFKQNGIKTPMLTKADLKALPLDTRNKLIFKTQGNEAVLDLLLATKVSINQKDEYAFTPLHYAVLVGNLACIFKLIHNDISGTTVNAPNLNEDTPLILAADRLSAHHILRMLLAGGANVNHQNIIGMSALHVAAAKGYTNNIRALVEQKRPNKEKINLNLQDKEGWTALHHAVQNEHFETVKYLVEVGANVLLTTHINPLFPQIKPETPRHFAAQFKDSRMYLYLLKKELELLSLPSQKTTPPIKKIAAPVRFKDQHPTRHMATTLNDTNPVVKLT